MFLAPNKKEHDIGKLLFYASHSIQGNTLLPFFGQGVCFTSSSS